jgi:hypothetical protein
VEKDIKEMKDQKAEGDYDVPEDLTETVGRRQSHNRDTTDQQVI